MFKSDKRLLYWYRKYNKLYFDNKLPTTILVGWNDEMKADTCAQHNGVGLELAEDGITLRITVIHLDPKKHVGSTDTRLSLLHEMCHVALFPYDKHGKKFKDEKRRLAMLGALDDLW